MYLIGHKWTLVKYDICMKMDKIEWTVSKSLIFKSLSKVFKFKLIFSYRINFEESNFQYEIRQT